MLNALNAVLFLLCIKVLGSRNFRLISEERKRMSELLAKYVKIKDTLILTID